MVCRIGVAICLVLAVVNVTGCGSRSALGKSGYSVADVSRAFGAEGLPLRSLGRVGGALAFVGRDPRTKGFSILLFPRHKRATLDVTVSAADKQRLKRLDNVVIAFDPTAAIAARVRAAIERLKGRATSG
jgi:hypothetical protein